MLMKEADPRHDLSRSARDARLCRAVCGRRLPTLVPPPQTPASS